MATPVPLDMLPDELRGAPAPRAVPLDMLPDELRPMPAAPAEKPQEELGFLGALREGSTVLGDVPEAFSFATGRKGAREELVKARETEEKRATGFGADKSLDENWQTLKEMAGESLGQFAAPAAAGLAGTFAGGPLVGLGAAAATAFTQYGTQNLARQAEEDEARIVRGEKPLGPMPGRAAAAAVGQTGLDFAGARFFRPLAELFPFARPLLGGGSKKAAGEAAEAVVEAARKGQITYAGGIARGTAKGAAFEMPQEIAQTALERWQAGLPLDDDSALEEYKQSAVGALVLGGGIGAVSGGLGVAKERAASEAPPAAEPPASAELLTEFDKLFTAEVASEMQANPGVTRGDIAKRVRERAGDIAEQARANVEATQTQAKAGAGLDGGAGQPDVDVAGAAGAGVPVAGAPTPTGEATQTVSQAEPIGVAGTGEPAGVATGAETGADSTLTPITGKQVEQVPSKTTIDINGQKRTVETAPTLAGAQQLAAELGVTGERYPALAEATLPEAETQAAETQAAEDFYPDLMPAYTAETSVAKQRALAPVVANIFSKLTGLQGFNSPKIKALPENVQKAYNATVAAVLYGVKPGYKGKVINPEIVAQQKMAEFNVTLPGVATQAAPEVAPKAAPAETAVPPTYTYADLVAEADSLVASNPDLVLPGQLTAQQFQQFSIQAEQMPTLAEQGVEVPSATELRQDLYKMAGREAPPLAAPTAPEPAAAEEYDADALAAAATQAPSVWAALSKQQAKGKPPAAWKDIGEEAQDEFIVAIAAIPGDLTGLEFANTVRPIFNAIRTGKPVPQAAPAPAAAAPAPAAPAPTAAAPPAPTAAAPPAAPPGAPPTPPTPPSGAAPQPGGKGPKKPKATKAFALTPKQLEDARRAAGLQQAKANKMQSRVASTREASEILSNGVSLAKLLRGDKGNLAILQAAVDTMRTGSWKALLPTLSTEDIFRILKGRIEGLLNADRIIRQDVTRYEASQYLTLAKELETVAKFLKKFPKAAQVLTDLQFMTVAYQVDPTKADTAQGYIDNVDVRLKELRAERAQATDNKKRAALSRYITVRERAIRAVYDGGLVNGERVYGWRDISKPEFGGGKLADIFSLIRDAHRRDLLANYKAIQDRITATSGEANVKERLAKLKETFTPALNQIIYFPLMRYGDYFVRVGKGAESIFMMFPTTFAMNKAVRVMRDSGKDVTEFGDVKELRQKFQSNESSLQGVLDLFGENPGKDVDTLREQVFDLWLQTAAVGDMTKHMAPREMRAGYSTDVLKNFANFRRSAVNATKRSLFGHKLKLAISQARDSVEGTPDQEKMNAFIKEIELRAVAKLLPDTPDNSIFKQAIELGNKMAFYQYLANPKSGLIQLTQLHITSFPILAQKYGHAKAGAALAKYGFSSLGGFVTSPLKAIKRPDGEFEFDWQQPNLLDNPVTSLKEDIDPQLYEVLSEGWQAGHDINLYLDTFAQSVTQVGTADPEQRTALQNLMKGRVDTAAIRGAKFVFNAMGGLMHQMERVNREATYMAALELGYRENIKRGLSHEKAKAKAIEDATASTLEATFDFSSYNKPRVFNEGVGKVAGQFFTYPYMLSSLVARKLFTAIKKGPLEPGERAAAAEIAAGTLMNLGLYAGLTGLPFYGLAKVIGYMMANLFDDDDEEGGLTYFDPETGDIRATYDIDWWFRNVWIPKFFGPGGTVATLFDLTPEQAKALELSAAKGPISALTDVDLANSVALDFFFFLPEEPRAETLEGQLVETVFNAVTGASGSMLLDYAKAGRDLMNGYTERALEKLPKVVSNPLKAARFAKEGQLNYQDELVGMGKDFWTSDKQILQSLGFASTEADRKIEQVYGAKGIEKKIEAERNRVSDRFKKAVRRMEKEQASPEAEAELNETLAAVNEYNQVYPTHPISGPSLSTMANNAVADIRKSQAFKGVPFDMEGKTPYLTRMMRQRAEEQP
jgi:hypothetical protein